MRTLLFFAPLAVLLACGGKGNDTGHGGGGSANAGSAATSGSAGVANEAGATSTSGGQPSGSAGAFTSGGSTTSGGAATTGGEGGQGTGGSELVDCDLRKVLCKAAQPICPENQVPSVDSQCFGPCVPIETCACSAAAECPFNDRYTCWQRTHCGPYVR